MRRDENGKLNRFDVVNSMVEGSFSAQQVEPEGDVWIFSNFAEGVIPPTDAEIDAEIARIDAEYSAQEYTRKRQDEYPSIQELVVALYDTDDKSAIEAKRSAVKLKYPKPE